MYREKSAPYGSMRRENDFNGRGRNLLLGSLILAMLSLAAGCTQVLAPMVVANLQASAVSNNEAQLSWSDAQSEDGYRIERAIDDGAFVVIAETPSGTTSFTDEALSRGLTYCYRVQAFNLEGVSPYSNVGCVEIQGGYTDTELSYFEDIAFGSEFGSTRDYVVKWTRSRLRVSVIGDSSLDLMALTEVLDEITNITGILEFEYSSTNPDIEVFFAPLSMLPAYIPEYVEGNWGFFYINWDSTGQITHAKIAVATDVTSHQERQHLIREEVTQSLGLINDAWLYADSIFYQGWTATTAYAPIDRALIEMLYRNEVRPGMSQTQTLNLLSSL
jgi:DUF2927 family protein/fibronectin type III domain protein